MRRMVTGLLIALALYQPAAARAGCTVSERTMVPLERTGDLMIVPVLLNDQPARFLLDTGAQRTVVTTEAARRLDLARDEWVATPMQAANGALERNRNANPRSISLGGVALRHRSVARDSSLVVTTPTAIPGTHIDGLLGRDFLASFDLSLDLQAGTLRLFDVAGCGGRFLPWSAPYVALPVMALTDGGLSGGRKPEGSAVVIRAEVDGVPLRALLDTGASHSLIAAPGIHKLGLAPDASDTQVRIGMSAAARPLDGRMRRVGTLRLGAEVETSVPLLIAPVRMVPIVDMILGADWFAGRSVWLSFSSGQVFVSRRE